MIVSATKPAVVIVVGLIAALSLGCNQSNSGRFAGQVVGETKPGKSEQDAASRGRRLKPCLSVRPTAVP